MNPEQRIEKIEALRRKENFAGAIGLAGAIEMVGSLLLATSKTGDERAMALAASVVACIPTFGGMLQGLRYTWKKQGLLHEEALFRLLERGELLVQTVKELPQETFDKLWAGFQGIRDVLRDSVQLEREPFDLVYQVFADRAEVERSEGRPS